MRVWVPKYGPMDGFGQKISDPNFFGTSLELAFGSRAAPARPDPARPEKELVHDLHFDKGALLIMFFEVVRGLD